MIFDACDLMAEGPEGMPSWVVTITDGEDTASRRAGIMGKDKLQKTVEYVRNPGGRPKASLALIGVSLSHGGTKALSELAKATPGRPSFPSLPHSDPPSSVRVLPCCPLTHACHARMLRMHTPDGRTDARTHARTLTRSLLVLLDGRVDLHPLK